MPKARYQDQDMTHRKTRRRREIERAIADFVSSGGGGLKASPKSGKRRESRPNTIFRKDRKRRCRGRALPIQYGSGFRYTQRVAALGADRRGLLRLSADRRG